MRVPCEHGHYETHSYLGLMDAIPAMRYCDGGHDVTNEEWADYGREQGWIDYEAALKYFPTEDPTERLIVAIAVDAAVGGSE